MPPWLVQPGALETRSARNAENRLISAHIWTVRLPAGRLLRLAQKVGHPNSLQAALFDRRPRGDRSGGRPATDRPVRAPAQPSPRCRSAAMNWPSFKSRSPCAPGSPRSSPSPRRPAEPCWTMSTRASAPVSSLACRASAPRRLLAVIPGSGQRGRSTLSGGQLPLRPLPATPCERGSARCTARRGQDHDGQQGGADPQAPRCRRL